MRRDTVREKINIDRLNNRRKFIIKGDQEKAAKLRKKPTRSVS